MGQIDRIPPVQAAFLQTQASSSVNERKEGRQPQQEHESRDKLELHDAEELEFPPELECEVIDFPLESRLDLTA